MNDNDREWTRRHPREWGIGNIIAIIAAMGVMMAVITLTLHRNFPLVATGPSISASACPPRYRCLSTGVTGSSPRSTPGGFGQIGEPSVNVSLTHGVVCHS
jgi:hypothetical protein